MGAGGAERERKKYYIRQGCPADYHRLFFDIPGHSYGEDDAGRVQSREDRDGQK